MDCNINLEILQQSCRVCLQKGDINIWDFRVKLTEDSHEADKDPISGQVCTEDYACRYMNTLELMDIFSNTMDVLELSDVFPLLCLSCLEDFKLCYMFYEKLKNANTNLKKNYDEYLNQCVKEEHLLEENEDESMEEATELPESNIVQNEEITHDFIAKDEGLPLPEKDNCTRTSINNTYSYLDENSSLVVTQYVPSTLESISKFFNSKNEDDEDLQPARNLLTVDCKAVEVKQKQLESLETHLVLASEQDGLMTMPAVFLCQYCPQAFTKPEFLKTHIQKTHICKFCTQPFNLATDLYSHIRAVHTEHKCVICQKILSSSTNLRHHIKRVHRIKLPPKMTLLDFIQTSKKDSESHYHASPDSMGQFDLDYSDEEFDTNIYFSTASDLVDMPNNIV